MIDDRELRTWVARLESEASSWDNYARLAVLYAVRDRQRAAETRISPVRYSAAPAPGLVEDLGDSDFLRAVAGRDSARAWAVMDELMRDLRAANERVYDRVMRKIMDL